MVSMENVSILSSSGRSPGRAIVLPPAAVSAAESALAKSLTLKFFYVMGKMLLGELSRPCNRSCSELFPFVIFSIEIMSTSGGTVN